MTTGSKGSGSGGYPLATAYWSKTWDGADGWYEIYHGRVRVKFNRYNMRSVRESPLIGEPFTFVGAGNSSPNWDTQDLLPWYSRDEFELQSRLTKRIKGHDFNLAVNLAQMNQTVSMCANTIRKLSSSIRALKHGNVASAARLLFGADSGQIGRLQGKLKGKDVSSQWLEMQYGWLPFLGDCFESAKAFEAYSSVRSTRVVAKLKKKDTYDGSAAPTQYHCPGKAVTIKKIVYEMTEDISLPRTMGLLDPLSVAWEIIPYSFVVDWFVPIGSYLENLAVIPSLQGRFCSTLYQEKQAAYKYGIAPSYVGKNYRRAYFANSVKREVTSALATQMPTFINGPFTALSARRIFSAISLGHQRMKDFPGSKK